MTFLENPIAQKTLWLLGLAGGVTTLGIGTWALTRGGGGGGGGSTSPYTGTLPAPGGGTPSAGGGGGASTPQGTVDVGTITNADTGQPISNDYAPQGG